MESQPPMNATFENAGTSISNTVSDAAKSFSDPIQVDTTSTSFLDSNGIIAKIVFLILVIIVFVILFFIAVKLIGYFSQPANNPMLVNGQISATKTIVIKQNPSDTSSKTLIRSNNESSGIEFTWSVWLSLSPDGVGQEVTPLWHSPIFVKGDASLQNNGVNQYCSLNIVFTRFVFIMEIYCNILSLQWKQSPISSIDFEISSLYIVFSLNGNTQKQGSTDAYFSYHYYHNHHYYHYHYHYHYRRNHYAIIIILLLLSSLLS